ncbi:hypothetical protein FACS189449_04250 [Alphaproteobacteria bacterium]|nr:hypothetical protein FACS189449_04250 [Alphaproteobacteria bacterium]
MIIKISGRVLALVLSCVWAVHVEGMNGVYNDFIDRCGRMEGTILKTEPKGLKISATEYVPGLYCYVLSGNKEPVRVNSKKIEDFAKAMGIDFTPGYVCHDAGKGATFYQYLKLDNDPESIAAAGEARRDAEAAAVKRAAVEVAGAGGDSSDSEESSEEENAKGTPAKKKQNKSGKRRRAKGKSKAMATRSMIQEDSAQKRKKVQERMAHEKKEAQETKKREQEKKRIEAEEAQKRKRLEDGVMEIERQIDEAHGKHEGLDVCASKLLGLACAYCPVEFFEQNMECCSLYGGSEEVPDDPRTSMAIARAFPLLGKYHPQDCEKSVALIRRAADLNSNRAQSFLGLMCYHGCPPYISRDLDRAMVYYQNAYEQSKNPEFISEIAKILIEKQEYDKAIEYYQKAYEQNKNPEFISKIAKILIEKQEYDKAIELCDEAYKQNHDNAIIDNIANDLLTAKQYDKLIRWLSENFASDAPGVQLYLGMAYRDKGNIEKAIEHLTEAVHQKDPLAHFVLDNIHHPEKYGNKV